MPSPNDTLKDAFQKVKHDVYSLYSEISSLKRSLLEVNSEMAKMSEILSRLTEITQKLSEKQQTYEKNPNFTQKTPETTIPTNQQVIPTIKPYSPTTPTHLPANFPYFNKGKEIISTGNEGVPTDRQTDQQTDNNNEKSPISLKKPQKTHENPINDAVKALDSLDSLKKEIRLKFKQLTDQEILIFSTLYQIEEEQGPVDYKTIAVKLNLTESSIRDYVGRLLQKGIPVEKQRINNKKIVLSVSENLKRVASLQTILQLRDL